MFQRLWRDVLRTSVKKTYLINADLHPIQYVLGVPRSVKSSELEQSLLAVPLGHPELLVRYITILSESGAISSCRYSW
jgi:hypothetical protein